MKLLFWRKKKEETIPANFTNKPFNVEAFAGGSGGNGIRPSIQRSLLTNEKKIKKFISHKIAHSKSLNKPDKMAREIYKWLTNNL